MSNMRIVGVIIGFIGVISAFFFYRGKRWNRLSFLSLFSLGVFLIIVSVNPNVVGILRDMLALKKAAYSRIISLLILSNGILWFYAIYFKSNLDELRFRFDKMIRKLGLLQAQRTSDVGTKMRPIMVLIPAFNEAENLKELLPRIPKKIAGTEIGVLVINDGSEDDTAAVAKDNGVGVIDSIVHRGGGAALRIGYDIIGESDCKICVTMDADGQHLPEEMKNLIRPIMEQRYDFVIGSRILGQRERDNRIRIIGLRIFNFLINSVLESKITDCSSGYRAFKVDSLKKVLLREDQYHTAEFIIDAVKKGYRIGEVPITMLKRKHGVSKKGRDINYGINFAKSFIKAWWR